MTLEETTWRRWLAGLAFGATVANLVSIAVAHVLLGAGVALLLARPRSVRVPTVIWPVLALVAWTLLSALLSDEPALALPQVKKLFVFATLPLVYTAVRTPDQCNRLSQAWFVAMLGSCTVAIGQFAYGVIRSSLQGSDFDGLFAGARITGFYSHWMTFSQTATIIAAALACYILFARRREGSGVWTGAGLVILAGLLLSFTRSAWLAVVVCALYLLVLRRPRLVLAAPVVAAVAYFAAPDALRYRAESMGPAANQSRIIMWRTGLNMISDHPLVGVGPERVGARFSEYQPADVGELPTAYYAHLHNVFIHFAAERGIPAALIVIWLFAQVLVDMRRGLLAVPPGRHDRRYLLHAAISATLAIAVLGCFDVPLGDSEVLAVYLAMLGIAYRGLPQSSLCRPREGNLKAMVPGFTPVTSKVTPN